MYRFKKIISLGAVALIMALKVAYSTPKLPTIEKFIDSSTTSMRGLTTLYQKGDKYYLNINDSLFGREIMMVTRISQAAQGIRTAFEGYSGDEINSALFSFEKGSEERLFLRKLSMGERSQDSTHSMFASVSRSNLAAIAATFKIVAQSADGSDNLIEVTDFFNSDSEDLFFKKRAKTAFKLGALQKESSYIADIKTFPINTEVKTVKTYLRTDRGERATYELNNSFLLLPKEPMTPRYADERVGYFTTGYTDYDQNPQGVKKIRMITRWRLEPKEEDIEKYRRGELVEPAKPIIFYIDPTTPKEWVPYLIAGVNDWQEAFERAGFKNAIIGKEAPTAEEDSTWSLLDARNSAIVYKPSETANASGPNVHDPRSGEIMESHINWYHNVMSLLRNWYFVQCAAVDPAARAMTLDQELMGQLIRFVSSHEVGHTLGLRHNFGGTALYTVEQLRDPDFLRENGHTTSIMDYSRFNYVAQREDNIPQELLFPRIGHYDLWAIEWGYRRFPEIDDPVAELPKLNHWIIEKTKDRRFWFGTESNASDPRLQAEDLSNNPMEANQLGIKNLKYIMVNLKEWSSTPNEDYSNLRTMHSEISKQFNRYIGHVAKWVGGIYFEPKRVEMEGEVYTPVEREKQIEALDFLDRNLFVDLPLWLIPDSYLNLYPSRAESYLESAFNSALSTLLSRRVIMNLVTAENSQGRNSFTVEELFERLNSSIWGTNRRSIAIDGYRRVLQKSFVIALCDLYTGASSMGVRAGKASANPKDQTECTAVALYQLQNIERLIQKNLSSDFNSRAHQAYLLNYIEKTLNAPQNF